MQPQVLATAIAASLLAAIAMPDASSGIARAQTPEKITVRFTWKLKGEYAPLFVALEKGYYSAEGLDVQLSEGNGAQNVLKALAAGNEKFGYGPAVAAARAVSQGLPIKGRRPLSDQRSDGCDRVPRHAAPGPEGPRGQAARDFGWRDLRRHDPPLYADQQRRPRQDPAHSDGRVGAHHAVPHAQG